MGRRFAIVIGAAATGVMALGAQTMAAAPKVVKYGTQVTISREGHREDGEVLWHGGLRSKARKCVEGRRVVLLRQRRGPDRRLGSSDAAAGDGWGVTAPTNGRVYAKAKETPVCRADRSRIIENGDFCPEDPEQIFGCRADRSPTIKRSSHPRSLGAQTAAAAPDAVKYDTQVTISADSHGGYHGWVRSKVKKCMEGRRVILFKVRPGPDRKLDTAPRTTQPAGGPEDSTPQAFWGLHVRFPTETRHGDVYAKVQREVGDGFVCRADRSKTLTRPGETGRSEPVGVGGPGVPAALGAQAAVASEVVKYRTELTMGGGRCCLFHGFVKSRVRKCMEGRRVSLFKQRPGADRRLGTDHSQWEGAPSRREGSWGVRATARNGDRIYASVEREVLKDGDVCRGDRSETI